MQGSQFVITVLLKAWVLILLGSPLHAAVVNITGVNYTGGIYVIDSDASNASASYDRDRIAVSVAVGMSGTPFTEPVRNYRVRFRLYDSTGAEVPLVAGTQVSEVIAWPSFNNNVTGAPGPSTIGFTGRIQPSVQLNSDQQYRVEAQVQRNLIQTLYENIGSSAFSSFRRFYHFTNTVPNDAALNVIARMGTASPTFSQRFLINDSPTQDGVLLPVSYTLRRYDNYTASSPTSVLPVEVIWQVRLFRVVSGGADVEIPLIQDSSWVTPVIVPFYVSGTPRAPAVVTGNTTLKLRPGQQLNSTQNYYATVTISHREVPGASGEILTANGVTSNSARLLHFNGRLDFGAIRTQLVSLLNDPATGSTVAGSEVNCNIEINQAHIFGTFSGHTLNSGQTLSVRLLSNGRAIYSGINSVTVIPPASPDRDELGNIDFIRAGISLSTAGASGTVAAIVPQGMTVTTTAEAKVAFPFLAVAGIALDQQLKPIQVFISYTPPNPVYVAEETKPVLIQATEIVWDIAQSKLDVRTTGLAIHTQKQEIADLEGAPVAVPAAARIKRSNDLYYAKVDSLLDEEVVITARSDNKSAELTASFVLNGGDFRCHFPYDTQIIFNGGRISVQDDVVLSDPQASRLDGVNPLTVTYQQACVSLEGCTPPQDEIGTFTMIPFNSRLLLTADGGLINTGTFSSVINQNQPTNQLRWGYINQGLALGNDGKRFAHATTSRFTSGTFHATGHFLRGTLAVLQKRQGPAVIHFTGFSATDPGGPPERPNVLFGTYKTGNLDYAGINLRVANEPANFSARAIIADVPSPEFPLKTRSKYYVRPGGVSGIHDAQQTPGAFVLYGFPVSLANFSLAFLDTQNVDSATLGDVTVPYPSDFVQSFERLLLTCLGDLQEADIPDEGEPQTLAYWEAEFQPYTLAFEKLDGCYPGGDAALVMTIETNVHHVPAPLYGAMGWHPSGHIVNAASPYTVTSRFALPNLLTLAGPGSEKYNINPVSEAYFNEYANAPAADRGFASFAAYMAVPYFEKLHVHIHTFARAFEPPQGAPPSRLHLMGGWRVNNKTFFNDPDFDSAHRGFPNTSPAVTLLQYRNEGAHRMPLPTTDPATDPYRAYRVYAKREFLGVVDFEYPIEFNSGARIWTSSAPQADDLLVFNTSHQVDSLSPQYADLTFGVSLKSLPSISLSNAAFSFVDEVAGENAVVGGLLDVIGTVINPDPLNEGLALLGQVTGDKIDPLVNAFITSAIDPIIAQAYTDLRNIYISNGNSFPPGSTTTVLATLSSKIDGILSNTSVAVPLVINADSSLLTAIRVELLKALNTAIAGIDQLATVNATQSALFNPGSNGQYQLAAELTKALVSFGSPEVGAIVGQIIGPALDQLVAEQVQRGAPTMDAVRQSLLEIRGSLVAMRDSVQNGNGQFTQALRTVVINASSGANAQTLVVAQQVRQEALSIINNPQQANLHLTQYNRTVFEEKLRNRFRNQLRSRQLSSDLLSVMRQYLYDTDDMVRGNIDSGFRVVNRITRDLLIQVIEEVTPDFTGALGELQSASSLVAAQMNGYARIQGDTLRSLRIDMFVKMDLMSALEADMYLQIDTRQSDGANSCSPGPAGSYFTEVQIGAKNIEAAWLGDMRLDVGMKFTLADNGHLLGLGGAIELTAGKAKFETYGITDFGATAMFGSIENYVGARARGEFNRKALRIGFFFGKTCSIEPLKLVDKDVAKVLGNPPFTGGYIYGEMSYPLNEILGIPSTCFLSLTGTVGAGVWVFIENPEFGGKLYYKIQGEVLCVFDIGGEITLLGGKSGNQYVLKGKGRLWVEFCALICFSGEAGVRVHCRASTKGTDAKCDFDVDV